MSDAIQVAPPWQIQKHSNAPIPPRTDFGPEEKSVPGPSHSSKSTTTSTRLKSPQTLWKPRRRISNNRSRSWNIPRCLRVKPGVRGIVFIFGIAITICIVIAARQHISHSYRYERHDDASTRTAIQASYMSSQSQKEQNKPEGWLRRHSDNLLRNPSAIEYPGHISDRPKAALISLVRNEELEGILQSMRQLEFHWNCRYRYPWVFFSEKPFSEEFKSATSNATTASTSYHLIPKPHWSTPTWVDHNRHHDSLAYLHTISVGKGHLPSYRHMCRWNSGFFYEHPALANYEYYWRVEPDVHFFCHIPYDPFRYMRDNALVYGFNMNILDDARSFASLWRHTTEFAQRFPHLVHPDADLSWLVDGANAGDYNNCQFFSNFEIASLDFFRGAAHTAYFHYLDEVAGGFFYERYGDAPIHTLSVALFAPKEKVWFFKDIGYQHDIARHCPEDGVVAGRCACEPTGLDENFYKLVPMESPQRKPADTCIRLWLGGEWLEKKEGWDQETDLLMGGDGYGGYVRDL